MSSTATGSGRATSSSGVPSSGLHTNGYSLARRIVFDVAGLDVDSVVEELGGTIGEALLAPHRSYLRLIEPLLSDDLLLGLAHITGGGLTDNLPRIFPAGTAARIDRAAWDVPRLFRFLQRIGDVPADDMYRTFNMGIGLVAVVRPDRVDHVLGRLHEAGERGARVIGEMTTGEGTVAYA